MTSSLQASSTLCIRDGPPALQVKAYSSDFGSFRNRNVSPAWAADPRHRARPRCPVVESPRGQIAGALIVNRIVHSEILWYLSRCRFEGFGVKFNAVGQLGSRISSYWVQSEGCKTFLRFQVWQTVRKVFNCTTSSMQVRFS